MSLFPYLRRQRWRYLLGIALLLLTASFIMAIPKLVQKTIDLLLRIHSSAEIAPYCIAIIVLALIFCCVRIASRYFMFNPARTIEYDIRGDFLAFLLAQPISFFQKHATGDLMSRATSDLGAVRAMLGPGILNVVNTLIYFTFALIMMLSIHARLTLYALLPLSLLFLMAKLSFRKVYERSRAVQELLGQLSGRIENRLRGITILKAFHREEQESEEFATKNESMYQAHLKLARTRSMMSALFGVAGSFSTVILLGYGGFSILNHTLTLGEFVAFNSYLALLAGPTIALGWVLNSIQRGVAAFERLRPYLRDQRKILRGSFTASKDMVYPRAKRRAQDDKSHKNVSRSHTSRFGAIRRARRRFKGEIRFEGVAFQYPNAGSNSFVLQNLSLPIPAGSTLGIVGPIGAGKSTLVKLIPRLFEKNEGKISLDSEDLSGIDPGELRSAIGFVPQEAFLFSRTLEENILFGLNRKVSKEEKDRLASEAARHAQLSGEIDLLPGKLHTVVGERGVTLSGGQRSRVAIARALVGDHDIYIFDDALANIDSGTEHQILISLRNLLSGKTLIFVAHRLSAIRECDQIIVLENGRMTQRGIHKTLLEEKDGYYARTYRIQQLEAHLE
ncbi:MAG: ABC transporter ATP-binding protein [Deltaproteobacteria bacterium]|nr:ABC transporter ATP-binding protein [Deltaproteobacteria bacterium]